MRHHRAGQSAPYRDDPVVERGEVVVPTLVRGRQGEKDKSRLIAEVDLASGVEALGGQLFDAGVEHVNEGDLVPGFDEPSAGCGADDPTANDKDTRHATLPGARAKTSRLC